MADRKIFADAKESEARSLALAPHARNAD